MQMEVKDVRNHFIEELKHERYTVDKTGQNTIELLGASFLANESSIFGSPNDEYITREIDWYLSHSLNINDIYGLDRPPPEAWEYAANQHGSINSNYGTLIFDDKFAPKILNNTKLKTAIQN